MTRRAWIFIGVALVVLLTAGAGAAYYVVNRPVGDVRNTDAEFLPEDEPAPSRPADDGGSEKGGKPADGDAALAPPWPVYGRDAARTRDASELTDIRPPYRVLWRQDKRINLEHPPSYRHGVLYIGMNGGTVQAIHAFTGRKVWTRKFDNVVNQPALYRNLVIFCSYDQYVRALDRKTGDLVWRTRIPQKMESSIAVVGGLAYLGGHDGVVVALDADTGRVRWRFQADAEVKDSMAVADGRVFFGDYAGVMYALRARDGGLIWRTQTNGLRGGFGSGNFYSTPSVRYGRVYIGNTDGKVYSFVASTGEIAWTYTMPDWAYGSPGTSGGRVFTTSFDGTVVALSARTGAEIWKRKLPTGSLASPSVIGKLVYVASLGPRRDQGGRLYAFDPESGQLRWEFHDGKYSTVVAGGGHLFVAGWTHLYALKPRKST